IASRNNIGAYPPRAGVSCGPHVSKASAAGRCVAAPLCSNCFRNPSRPTFTAHTPLYGTICGKDLRSWSPRSISIANMPIYRQLFDFLCLVSIEISVAEASGRTYLCRKECVHSDQQASGDGCLWLALE